MATSSPTAGRLVRVRAGRDRKALVSAFVVATSTSRSPVPTPMRSRVASRWCETGSNTWNVSKVRPVISWT